MATTLNLKVLQLQPMLIGTSVLRVRRRRELAAHMHKLIFRAKCGVVGLLVSAELFYKFEGVGEG